MKITLAVPEGQNRQDFVNKEISACRNIKDKTHKDQVTKGLNKINAVLKDSMMFLYDGEKEELFSLEYQGKDFIYHCGKNYVIPPPMDKCRYGLVVMDANHAVIAELRGKKIIVLWEKESYVPRKQGSGGQSAERFARNRKLAMIHWQKEIADKMMELWYQK